MAVVCLMVGTAVGYLARGFSSQPPAGTAPGTSPQPAVATNPNQAQAPLLQQALDQQVTPLLQQLERDPDNPGLLASIGNLYYDAQQYQQAIAYYGRSLQIQPGDTSVRTDMGTAYWYLGNADRAIAEFRTALQSDPTKANTLFNLGIVEWQGKQDGAAAVAAWQKLLDTNPAYENRDKVKNLMEEAKHSKLSSGTAAGTPAR
jgi:cytochrome c-type biogenesis protein CcmH/NrfG